MSRRRKRLRARIYYECQVVEFDGRRWRARDPRLADCVQVLWISNRFMNLRYFPGSIFEARVHEVAKTLGTACYVVEPDASDRYCPPDLIY